MSEMIKEMKRFKKEAKRELKQYLWIQMRLDEVIEHCAEEKNSADFRALLEPDINGEASETTSSSGENKCVDGDVPKEALCASLRRNMIFHYFGNKHGKKVAETDESATPWVEIHANLVPLETRQTHSATENGLNMGGCLSVRFPSGFDPIVKVGGD